MNELKFRAWNGRKMVPVSLIKTEYEFYRTREGEVYVPTSLYVELANGECLRFDPNATYDERVMQYSGLRDKNGVEIYKDDIVSLLKCASNHFSCTCKKTPSEFTDKVRFEDGAFVAVELERPLTEYEVIGNIYQNPELLK